MVTALLDGWTFVDLGPDGDPYDEMGHPKVVLHTTEGTTLAGAEAAFKDYPPHLGYDPVRRIKRQYVRLDRHSYALRGSESDDEFVIQVEIVGFAQQTHLWSDEVYRNIGRDLIGPLSDAIAVPPVHLRFYRADEGIVLATATSPIRLSDSELRAYTGWLGHQHVPAPDSHWDPGGFLMDKALHYGLGGSFMSELDVEQVFNYPGQSTGDRLSLRTLFSKLYYTIADMNKDGEPISIRDIHSDVEELKGQVAHLSERIDQLLETGQTIIGEGAITFKPKAP